MQARILVIAPFPALADEVRRVLDERMGKRRGLFRVVVADLVAAKDIVQREMQDSIKAIVSRGGTAGLIEETTHVPVVRIQVSLVDIMRAVLASGAGSKAKKVGVSGFENMVYGCDDLGALLRMKLVEIKIKGEAEAKEKIAHAMEDGVDLLIGDAVSVRVARAQGLAAKTIDSGRQAIFQALTEALLIARVVQQDEAKSEMLRAVVHQSQDAIIATDHEGRITIFNPEAERLVRRVRFEVLGKPLARICPALLAKPAEEDFLDLYGTKALVKTSDLPDGMTIYRVQRISEVQRTEQRIRQKFAAKGLTAKYHMEDIIGSSAPCEAMKRKAMRYALTDSTILITGASGTGKEMLVQGIHNRSSRRSGPFVAVNCAALPENLLESELFGYVDGAFTGARRGGRQGLFELAHGGTIFLDEIGEVPTSLQSRLLRVLQEHEVMKLGGESVIPVDVRIVAATNQNLARMVEEGTFRADLYYRLNILRIHMPTLAERRADIPLLARAMIVKMKKLNPAIAGIAEDAESALAAHAWPGNIRQLANVMERLMLLSDGTEITRDAVLAAWADDGEENRGNVPGSPREGDGALHGELRDVEEETVRRVLAEEGGSCSRAAKRLGIHRTTLWRKIKRKENRDNP